MTSKTQRSGRNKRENRNERSKQNVKKIESRAIEIEGPAEMAEAGGSGRAAACLAEKLTGLSALECDPGDC